ncbi:MAG: hypothetical protein R6U44_07160 [Archaeoglobaceae archaeon]
MNLFKGTLTILFVILVIGSFTYFTGFFDSVEQTSAEEIDRALIVDQLNLTRPNKTFVAEATEVLETKDYQVDYVAGKNVTVDFYRNLTSEEYDIIVFRVHSSASEYDDNPVVLFTSESYRKDRYQIEQVTNNLQKVYYNYGEEHYFAVSPKFIRGLSGDFDNATVILMGCEGLKHNNMGKAFVDKGAKVFVSWSGPVTATHSDRTTIRFLEHFVEEERNVDRSIIYAMAEIGSDTEYESYLKYYPHSAALHRVSPLD